MLTWNLEMDKWCVQLPIVYCFFQKQLVWDLQMLSLLAGLHFRNRKSCTREEKVNVGNIYINGKNG